MDQYARSTFYSPRQKHSLTNIRGMDPSNMTNFVRSALENILSLNEGPSASNSITERPEFKEIYDNRLQIQEALDLITSRKSVE